MTDDDRFAFVRIAAAQTTQLRVRLIVLALLAWPCRSRLSRRSGYRECRARPTV